LSLQQIITSGHINVAGQTVTKDGKTVSEFEVDITNAKNIPEDDEARKKLGRSVATLVKKYMKDPKEYDTYTVLFITETVSENSLAYAKKRSWKSVAFEEKEL
jgi:ribosomal protein S4